MFKISHDMAQISNDVNIISHELSDQAGRDKLLDDLDARIERIGKAIQNTRVQNIIVHIRNASKYIKSITPEAIKASEKTSKGHYNTLLVLKDKTDALLKAIFETDTDMSEQRRLILDLFDQGDIERIKTFLAHYPIDLNAIRDNNGAPLLNIACWRGDLKMIKFLLSKGVDVNYYDETCHAPIFLVILSENLHHKQEILNLLMNKGAKLTIKNVNRQLLITNLIDWAESTSSAQKKSELDRIIDSIRYLIQEGHIDITDEGFCKWLYLVAFLRNSPELIKLLAFSGAPYPDMEKGRKDFKELVEVFEQASKSRDDEIAKITKIELKGMPNPDVIGLISQYAGMESLTSEQRKLVIKRCLAKEKMKVKG